MEVVFLPRADDDLIYWTTTGNKPVLKRIAKLTEAILESPFEGIGKPEPLKHNLKGKWSRRITEEHRFIYRIENKTLLVYSLKGHY